MNTVTYIGFHGWHPGLAGNNRSADPNDAWLVPLFQYLNKHRIRPVWLGQTHGVESELADQGYYADVKDKLSGIFMYYRWPMSDAERYWDRNQAVRDQKIIIKLATEDGIPVAVFDGDYQISPSEQAWMSERDVLLLAPALAPKPGFAQLFYPPISGQYDEPKYPSRLVRRKSIIYIGNNYDRYDVVKHYFGFAADDKKAPELALYGNWMFSNSNRQSVQQVLDDFPLVRFYDRVDRQNVVQILSEAGATIHFAKTDYFRTGFIALRWQEASIARTPALVPREYMALPRSVLGRVGSREELRTISYEILTGFWQQHVRDSQAEFIFNISKYEPWLLLLESMAETSR